MSHMCQGLPMPLTLAMWERPGKPGGIQSPAAWALCHLLMASSQEAQPYLHYSLQPLQALPTAGPAQDGA